MSAVFSTCGNYRFILYRQWWLGRGLVLFIMLNPSTADHRRNDPTITACVSFAKRWGFPGMAVVNVCALRATNPAELYRHLAPIDLELGKWNDYWIQSAVESADLVVCAWGNHAAKLHREHHVRRIIYRAGVTPTVLRINQATGAPAHPLYLPRTLDPIQWPYPILNEKREWHEA